MGDTTELYSKNSVRALQSTLLWVFFSVSKEFMTIERRRFLLPNCNQFTEKYKEVLYVCVHCEFLVIDRVVGKAENASFSVAEVCWRNPQYRGGVPNSGNLRDSAQTIP